MIIRNDETRRYYRYSAVELNPGYRSLTCHFGNNNRDIAYNNQASFVYMLRL